MKFIIKSLISGLYLTTLTGFAQLPQIPAKISNDYQEALLENQHYKAVKTKLDALEKQEKKFVFDHVKDKPAQKREIEEYYKIWEALATPGKLSAEELTDYSRKLYGKLHKAFQAVCLESPELAELQARKHILNAQMSMIMITANHNPADERIIAYNREQQKFIDASFANQTKSQPKANVPGSDEFKAAMYGAELSEKDPLKYKWAMVRGLSGLMRKVTAAAETASPELKELAFKRNLASIETNIRMAQIDQKNIALYQKTFALTPAAMKARQELWKIYNEDAEYQRLQQTGMDIHQQYQQMLEAFVAKSNLPVINEYRQVKAHMDKLNKKAPSGLKDVPALIDKIKAEIARYDKIRREILAKYPELNVYRLRVHFYSKLGDYFRANKEYNDFRSSLDQTQKNNLKKYFALQRKKYMSNTENSDEYHRFRELLKLLKQYNPGNRVFAQFDRVFNFEKSGKIKFSASEQQQLDELGSKLSNPDLLNSILLSGHYNGGFNFYESCLRVIVEKPLKEQRKKISRLINKLYKLRDNKLDNEEKLFVKNCYCGLESDDVRKKIPLERYYRIEALLTCLKKSQLRETIKLRLKDNYALRKALVSLLAEKIYAMPADRHAWRGKRAEKTRALLNYDDFDKYWANLEKVCGKLLEDVCVKAYKRNNCSPEQIRLSQVAGRVFIECLFDIDAQGAVEVSGVFPPAHMKDVITRQPKPDPAIREINKLKQFAVACHMFANDNNGNLPGSIEQLKPYLGKLDLSNITLVEKGKKLRDFKRPSAVIMAVSTKLLKDGRYAAAFVDGHCKFIAQEELPYKLEGTK